MSARLLLLAGFAGLISPVARADVKPHPLFSDNMVLQRSVELPVWGTASPGEKVTISLKNAGVETGTAVVADEKGNWSTKLPAQKAGTDFALTFKGNNEIELKNVAVGDVWLCSGQSNMEWKLRQLTKDGQGQKVAAEATYPNLRLFTVPNRTAAEPQKVFPVSRDQGKWLECKPDTAINFSSVGYFFALDVQKSENIPIGLISSNWGGTVCEAWTSKEKLAQEATLKYLADRVDTVVKSFDPVKAEEKYQADLAQYQEAVEKAAKDRAEGKTPAPAGRRVVAPVKPNLEAKGVNQNTPTALFNGMIAPIVPFPIKGALWYQGESNSGRAAEYRTLFPAMIADWRERWGSEFPFLIVQLASYKGNQGSAGFDYAELRDAQTNATKVLPKVGIAVITDLGEENDIHPQKKEPVGQRLALAALAIVYGKKIEYSGPVFKEQKIEGDKVVLTFDHIGKGLDVKGEALNGFAVCGEDKVFHPAKAEIKGDKVVVSSGDVAKPVAVRFGWVNFAKPELNFFNKDGLPAVPFRTDDFPLTTAKK